MCCGNCRPIGSCPRDPRPVYSTQGKPGWGLQQEPPPLGKVIFKLEGNLRLGREGEDHVCAHFFYLFYFLLLILFPPPPSFFILTIPPSLLHHLALSHISLPQDVFLYPLPVLPPVSPSSSISPLKSCLPTLCTPLHLQGCLTT